MQTLNLRVDAYKNIGLNKLIIINPLNKNRGKRFQRCFVFRLLNPLRKDIWIYGSDPLNGSAYWSSGFRIQKR